MTVIHHTIELTGRTPLAQGTHCQVYAAPFDQELVIKVIRRDLPSPRNHWKKWKRVLHRSWPALQDRSLIREYAAYIKVRRAQVDRGGDLPVAHCAGVVATDRGLGMLLRWDSLNRQFLSLTSATATTQRGDQEKSDE